MKYSLCYYISVVMDKQMLLLICGVFVCYAQLIVFTTEVSIFTPSILFYAAFRVQISSIRLLITRSIIVFIYFLLVG